jgi:hypothetical protein
MSIASGFLCYLVYSNDFLFHLKKDFHFNEEGNYLFVNC